jgi:hypothetical protein
MALESINYIALFAGALLLMSRSEYRPRLWSYGKGEARTNSEQKSHAKRRTQRPDPARVVDAPEDRAFAWHANEDKSGARSPLLQTERRVSPGSSAAVVTPHEGHSSEDIMARHAPLTLAAALLATTVAAASAQTAQDHAAHHPADATQPAAESSLPGCPSSGTAMRKNGSEMPMGNMGSMMDGGMGQMTEMMGGGPAMAPFAHIEGRIAFLKTELAVTDAQTPQWSAFAGALRSGAKSMRESMANMMQADKPANAADRTDVMVKMMTARLDNMKSIAAAEKALYTVLTGAQKETADELLGGPMMGMRGSMLGMTGRINDVKP